MNPSVQPIILVVDPDGDASDTVEHLLVCALGSRLRRTRNSAVQALFQAGAVV